MPAAKWPYEGVGEESPKVPRLRTPVLRIQGFVAVAEAAENATTRAPSQLGIVTANTCSWSCTVAGYVETWGWDIRLT